MPVEIGEKISHYEIIKKIGVGGMGEVYLADDLKLERKVAIKILPQHLTRDKVFIERFEREAKAAASLNHPNIVTIYDVIEEGEQICIVMEYVEGKSLRDALSESKLEPEKIKDIITQLSEGLARAHRAGIIHRDIKPENIIIDKDARIRILDFGLAKLKGTTNLTRETSTIGTVFYMSPEQIQGTEVDHRSDIWSVGIVMYEIITGNVPFSGDYDSAVHYAILNENPDLGNINISRNVSAVIQKCLKKKPGDRYQNIEELIADLGGEKSESFPDKRSEKSPPGKFIILTISSFLFVLILLLYVFWPFQNSKHAVTSTQHWENSIAVLPFDNISNDPQQEYFADGMTEQIISNLARLPKLKVISRTSVMHYKKTNETIPEIGKALNVAYVLEGSIRKFGNRIRVTAQLINTHEDHYIWTENYDREYRELFDIQDEVSRAIAVNLMASLSRQDIAGIKTIRPQSTEAYEYYMKGRYFHYQKYWGATVNPEDFRMSEQMFLKAIDLDPTYALSYANLADLYNTYCRTSSLNKSEYQYYLQKQQIFLDKALELDSSLVQVQITKSWILQEKSKISAAFTSIRKALQSDPNDAYANATMGRFLQARGLINLARGYFEKAIETDPLQPMHYAWNSYCLTVLGNYEASENQLKQALTYDENHFVTVINYIYLLLTSGRTEQAGQMVAEYDHIYGKNEYMLAMKAMIYALNGDKERALNICPEESPYIYYIYAALDMTDKAIDYLNQLFVDRWAKAEESRYIEFKNNPLLENLRSNPRFREILAKHKELYEENLRRYTDIE